MKEWEIQGLEDVEWDQQKVLKCRLDLLTSQKMYVQGPQIRPLRADEHKKKQEFDLKKNVSSKFSLCKKHS